MSQIPDAQDIQDYLQENLDRYLRLLQKMVNINSFTQNSEGIDALGDLTADIFKELGFQAKKIPSVNPDFGHHTVLYRPGMTQKKIGLISHLDTVFPPDDEIKNKFHWRKAGSKIYGPGTVDIKGGTLIIFMIMDALQNFVPEIFEAIHWKVLLNASEETISIDFGELCKTEMGKKDVLACLVFEGGRYQDQKHFDIVVARKGMANYHLKVEGKASHAGSAHEKGANAIVQLAHFVNEISHLTDYERHLTFNVGTIQGGTVTNRVPHYAEAKIEMRTFSKDVFEEGVSKILALPDQVTIGSQDGYVCSAEVEIYNRTAPWQKNEPTEKLFSIWEETASMLGFVARREERGGLSDGNLIWSEYPTLDGLGPDGGNAHCSEQSEDGSKEQEFVNVNSFVPKTLLNTMAIIQLVANQAS